MATKNGPSLRSIGRQLNFATGRMNALCQRLLEPHELSLPQWVVLSCLWREGDLTVGALAERVGTGLPAMSRIVDRMVARDLVTRHRDATDRRATIVGLTEKGRALDHLRDFHERVNAVLLDGLSERERAAAFDLLTRMQDNAERALR
ncbi:MarR family winged helix-turn-helix transcriptional regulator [Jannaschia ovalis]|uniref:MarR family transcriptional regulator n=1 Tax=Jannaschia ovalis TaxID=3038773 RepID=A0ABY8L7P0_9RHOB|nr:MarR family transcriptional regulator [Jannaschia sp. GRR-S6-38]WGH77394.1 MarR family transcriptional regulator [Jannaschia sp. GRR-S6-38]